MKKAIVIARTGDVENAPENTLPAFESAIARGADGVEFDIHPTRDGELVIHHFYSPGATDDGEGLVCKHTLAELKALDSGSWFDQLCLAQQHILDWASLLGIWAVHLNIALITTDFVDLLHRKGFSVHGSNLDSEEEMRRGLTLGIDSFSTGHLGIALRLRDAFIGGKSQCG